MFPKIVTNRCVLRQIGSADQRQVFEGLSNEQVIKYYGISFATFEETKKQIDWYEDLYKFGKGIWWGISLKESPVLLGACGFNNISKENQNAEMGYWLLPEYWSKGIMKEVLPEILSYAFSSLRLHKIIASVETENIASISLLQKLGFKFEGRLKECEFKNDKFIDLNYYGLLERDVL